MDELLIKEKCWQYPPIPKLDDCVFECTNDDEDDDTTLESEQLVLEEMGVCDVDPTVISSDISKLDSAGVIEKDLKESLTTLKKKVFSKVANSYLPIYTCQEEKPIKKSRKSHHSAFVTVLKMEKNSTYIKLEHYGCYRKGRRCHLIGYSVCAISSQRAAMRHVQ